MMLAEDLERTVLRRTIHEAGVNAELTVLLFQRTRGGTPWLQLDDTGHIIRMSMHFRAGGHPAIGDRVVGFLNPESPEVDHFDVTINRYLAGERVLGLQPLTYDGLDLTRHSGGITATAGRSFPIVPPSTFD